MINPRFITAFKSEVKREQIVIDLMSGICDFDQEMVNFARWGAKNNLDVGTESSNVWPWT